MGKAAKNRDFPAAGRIIPAAECGEGRHSRYCGPATCPFNPFRPEAYDELLRLEETVDTALFQRAMKVPGGKGEIQRILENPLQTSRDHLSKEAALFELFHRRPAKAGQSLFASWAEEGFPGMKNDARVLFAGKQTLQPVLLEILQVADAKTFRVRSLSRLRGRFLHP